MLSRFFSWLGGKQEAAQEAALQGNTGGTQYAPGTQVSYDPMLITRFKGHHGSLLSIFGTISTSAASHDYPGVMDALQRFQRVLNEHLLEENLRLYTYLSKCLSGNEDSALLINQMRREMSEIGRTVTQFLRHYITSEVDGRNIDEFTEKLQGIGSALQDRISREENSLYTLYMPVADY